MEKYNLTKCCSGRQCCFDLYEDRFGYISTESTEASTTKSVETTSKATTESSYNDSGQSDEVHRQFLEPVNVYVMFISVD